MPLTPVTPVLAQGLLPMFIVETAPSTTRAAAQQWARAYTAYAVAGGIPALPNQAALALDLEKAFNPELAGKGPPLFIGALSKFWMGLPVPYMAGAVALFAPTSSNVNSEQPDDATPQDQANGLAQVISGFTLSAVKVLVPPGVLVPIT